MVIYHMKGEWEIRDLKLVLDYKFIIELIKQFEEINFEQLPSKENYMVDALATLRAMFKVNTNAKVQLVKMGIQESLVHCMCVEKEANGKPCNM